MMLPKIIDAFSAAPIRHNTVTIAMDVRSGEFFDADAVAGMISELRKLGHRMDIIFLEASDETLLDRYKETRRDHPLTQEGLTLMEAITEERTRLQPLRETANYVIDTTGLRSRALVSLLKRKIGELSEDAPAAMRAEVMSFGFKRGLPRQADLVLDVRFLPNPFYIDSLRQHSGLDQPGISAAVAGDAQFLDPALSGGRKASPCHCRWLYRGSPPICSAGRGDRRFSPWQRPADGGAAP